MNNNDTIKKTLIVAVSLCLVCSALISFSAVELRDLQEANKTLDKQNKILSAAGLLKEGSDVSGIRFTATTYTMKETYLGQMHCPMGGRIIEKMGSP